MIDDKIREIEDMLFTYKDYCNINQRNNKYNDVISDMDTAMSMVKNYKYFNFIEMRYFNHLTYEEIAEELSVDVRTVYRIRERILSKLKPHFKIQRLI
ncbi:sigma factor-like helix-turn-helix DNA-binding protein [uncultured Fusobacterium sp.]|uniref:sigma factor-like helix-turn-helix DNA-binding protein n=1 Tax=uncultured Fusobacterium sp. TaxID=159267 RepID=UPI0025EDC7AC|nr:sigma factor-like helix-turn-helix DNA-binding protein [uncultured Fusobacterium sp.]